MAFIKLSFVNTVEEKDLVKEVTSLINTDKVMDFTPVAQFGPGCDAPEGTKTRMTFLEGYNLVSVYCKESIDEILNLIADANQEDHN